MSQPPRGTSRSIHLKNAKTSVPHEPAVRFGRRLNPPFQHPRRCSSDHVQRGSNDHRHHARLTRLAISTTDR